MNRAPRNVLEQPDAGAVDRAEVRRLSSQLPHFIKPSEGTAEGADLGWEFDGTSADTDAVGGVPAEQIVSVDGEAPASSPAPTIQGGVGFLLLRWPAVANSDPVIYEVHLSETSGFTPDSTTLVGEVSGTMFAVRELADGSPLEYGTTYYAKIVARDQDGSADPSAEAAGTMQQATSGDIAVDAINAAHILAGSIDAEHLAAVITLSSLFRTAESGARGELDSAGLRGYGTDGVTENVNLPFDGSDPFLRGVLEAKGLSMEAAPLPGSGGVGNQLRWLASGEERASIEGASWNAGDVFSALGLTSDADFTTAAALSLENSRGGDYSAAYVRAAPFIAKLLGHRGESSFARLGVAQDAWFYSDLFESVNNQEPTGMARSLSGTNARMTSQGEAGRFGVWRAVTGTTSGGRAELSTQIGSAPFPIPLNDGDIRLGALVMIPTLSNGTNRFQVYVGLGRASSGTRRLQFTYRDDIAGGAWHGIAVNDAGALTNIPLNGQNGPIPVVAGTYYQLDLIINAAAGLAMFHINGKWEGEVDLSACGTTGFMAVGLEKLAGTAERELAIDAYWFHAQPETQRYAVTDH